MNRQSWVMLVVVLSLMGVAAGYLSHLQSSQKLGQPGVKVVSEPVFDPKGKEVGKESVYLPPKVLDYDSEKMPIDQETLSWLPKDTTYGRRHYRSAGGKELLFSAVLMGSDRTSIHKPEYCLTGQGWALERKETDSVLVRAPHPYELPVRKFTASRQFTLPDGSKVLRRAFYVFWFVAENELTASHEERMWWMARDMITSGVLQRWAYVSCLSPCGAGEEEATYARIKEFLAAAVPQFQLTTGREVKLTGEP